MYKISESEKENNLQILDSINRIHVKRSNFKNYYKIDTPPPGISGKLHIGHVFSYTQMDLIAKYHSMIGKKLIYPIGYDDNGLPTEKLLEKLLATKVGFLFNKTSEKCLIKNNIDPSIIKDKNLSSYLLCTRELFLDIGYKIIEKYENEVIDLYKKLNFSFNFENQYRTISDNSKKIAHTSFYDLYKKGLIYKKNGPVYWDSIDKTSISKADIKEEDSDSQMHYISFTLHKQNTKIVVMTTRIELLKSCLAIFYNPKDPRYNSKDSRVSSLKINKESSINLHCTNLENQYAVSPYYNKIIPILPDNDVKMDKGTGLVMCCSYGDWQDVIWINRYNLKPNLIINDNGKINIDKSQNTHISISEARKIIIQNINDDLIYEENITHAVKKSERSGVNVEILEKQQWFVSIKKFKNHFLEYSKNIKFFPEKMRVKLESWIDNINQDWCISRNRFLGIKIPENQISEYDAEDDKLVLDTWFTSSSTIHLGSKCGDIEIEKTITNQDHSCDLRPQAHDIIRTWAFYTLAKDFLHKFCKKTTEKTDIFIEETSSYIEILKNTNNSCPWKNIIISGWCLSKNKEKMSKSKNNAIDPIVLIDQYGSDAVRYWSSCTNLGTDTAFEESYLKDALKIINKISNISNFLIRNDEFNSSENSLLNMKFTEILINKAITNNVDKGFLSKFSLKIKDFFTYFENYEYSKARELIEKIFWDYFCNDYIELIKVRSYGKNSFLLKNKSLSVKENENVLKNQRSALMTCKIILFYLGKFFSIYMPNVSNYLIKSITNNQIFAFDESVIDASIFNLKDDNYKDYDLITDNVKKIRKIKSDNNVALNKKISKMSIDFDIKKINIDLYSDFINCIGAENAEIVNTNQDLIEFI